MIAKIRRSVNVWLVAAMLTAFMAVSWLFAFQSVTQAAPPPDDPIAMSQPFRVVSWYYLPQSEDWGQDWGADVVLKVTYDEGYAEHDELFIVDWLCFFYLIVGHNALNDFVSVPYGPAGEHYPDGWNRLLQIERTITS